MGRCAVCNDSSKCSPDAGAMDAASDAATDAAKD
jgi:hypothetical protein